MKWLLLIGLPLAVSLVMALRRYRRERRTGATRQRARTWALVDAVAWPWMAAQWIKRRRDGWS